ncbi:MAG: imelysin family protein [Myxococcota bacterium]
MNSFGRAELRRRQFLSAGSALFLAPACTRVPSREAVLATLVDEVVVSDLDEVERRGRDLVLAARRLEQAPALPELMALRAAWRRAALAWRRAAAFRAGPLLDSQALTRVLYWPPRRGAIAEALTSTRDVDASFVAELGADVKGLYALEYCLFDSAEGSAWAKLGGGSAHARRLVSLYAEDVCAHAEAAKRALAQAGYVKAFTRAGQDSINLLVSLLAENVERFAVARLNVVLWLASMQRLGPLDVEGGPSGSSHELLLALLLGCQRLYAGSVVANLSDLVRGSAERIDAHVTELFARVVAELRALRAPVESVALSQRNRVEAVTSSLRALESALKSELPTALGVTLTFASLDAD